MEIIDYFGLWEHDRSCDPQRRTLEEEREFWRCYARVYDQHAGETGGSLAQIAAVTEIVEPGSSVLDVGGGTGRRWRREEEKEGGGRRGGCSLDFRFVFDRHSLDVR